MGQGEEAFEASAIVSWARAASRSAPPLRVTGVMKSFGGGMDADAAAAVAAERKREPARRVVDDVSFEIRRGEIFGVIGANGSGKSTLIRMISTLLLPDAGDVQIFGLDAVRDAMRVRVADQPRVGGPVVLPEHDGAGEPAVLRPRVRADAGRGEARRRRRSWSGWASSGSGRTSR